MWRQGGVLWVAAVAVVTVGVLGNDLQSSGPVGIRFVKKNVHPSGDTYTSAQVSSIAQCGALCQLSSPCEAFVMRHTNNEEHHHKQTCTILTNFEATSGTTSQEELVYVRMNNEPIVTTVSPPSGLKQELRLEENIDEKEECSSNRAIAGLALTTGDECMSTVDFFECRKFVEPEKMSLDDKYEEIVETTPPKACTNNRVLVAFRAFKDDGVSEKRWDNPHTLQGVCHKLEKYQVNYNVCENVTVSSGPWIGKEHSTSHEWDTIFYCPPDTLAVGLTRELHDSTYKIMNLMCCQVTFAP